MAGGVYLWSGKTSGVRPPVLYAIRMLEPLRLLLNVLVGLLRDRPDLVVGNFLLRHSVTNWLLPVARVLVPTFGLEGSIGFC